MLSTLDAARRDKSQTENCFRVLFMTCWHKFQMIFNGRFIMTSVGRLLLLRRAASGVDTVLLTYREETKQPRRPIAGLPLLAFSPALESWSDIYTGPTSCLIIPQTFSTLYLIRHLLSVTRLDCSLNALYSISWVGHAPYCWLATSLFLVLGPDSKAFWKITYPTFNCSMLQRE